MGRFLFSCVRNCFANDSFHFVLFEIGENLLSILLRLASHFVASLRYYCMPELMVLAKIT